MTYPVRLLFGPLAATILFAGILGLALMVPGYSHVHQTVSEIGEMDSPARIPFALMLGAVALCILIFASGLRDLSRAAHHSTLAAYVIGFMAVSVTGVGIFAFPHPLHNIFGLSEIIGYTAPLIVGLTWRSDRRAKGLVAFTWVMFVVVWLVIGLNMSSMNRGGALWAALKPEYGLVQRALFVTWFGWVTVIGVLLYRRARGL